MDDNNKFKELGTKRLILRKINDSDSYMLYNKNGYAKEAVEKVLESAVNVLKYHRIEADIVDVNEDLIKLVEKLGMVFESTKQDSYKLNDEYYNQNVYVLLKRNKHITC